MKSSQSKTCGNCAKSFYLCVWPKGNESLPHKSSFKLTKLSETVSIPIKRECLDSNSSVENAISNHIEEEKKSESESEAEAEDNGVKNVANEFEDLDNLNEIGQLSFGVISTSFTTANMNNSNNDHQIVGTDLLEDLEYFNNLEIENSPSDVEYESLENNFDVTVINKKYIFPYETCGEIGEDIVLFDSKPSHQPITNKKEVKPVENHQFKKEMQEDAMFRKYLTDVGSNIRCLSQLNLSSKDGLLFEAFTKGFITSISPQIAHIKLQPGSVFIPAGIYNDVLQTLFLGCGAAFLALNNGDKELQLVSTKKTNESIIQLLKFLSHNTLSGNCDWLLIFLLLFYLKQKFVYENREILTLNIITAAEIIKLWVLIKEKQYDIAWQNKLKEEQKKIVLNESSSFLDLITSFSNIVSNMKQIVSNDENNGKSYNSPMKKRRSSNLDLDSSSLNIAFIRKKKPLIDLLPYQRKILESFIFNYTTSLFNFDVKYLHLLTSPYEIFESLGEYLSPPIFDCAVPWMNNPVVGASIPMIELQSKICWLALQTPFSNEDIKEIDNIFNLAKYFTPPILPIEVYQKEHESVQKKLMESCYGSAILAKAVTLYAKKLLNPELRVDDEEVQEIFNSGLGYIRKLSVHCQGASILLWAFTVIGCCATDPEQQEYLKWRMNNFDEILKLRGFTTSLSIQKFAWGGSSWDVLFDVSILKGFTL